MNALINLRRSVATRAWCFHGEIGLPQTRPWALALAKLAASQSGALTAADVSQHLLGGRLPLARGLIMQCLRMGILGQNLEAEYELTDLGRRAAEANQVFVPEKGTWILWFTEDQVVQERSPLLMLERWFDPPAIEETGKNRRAGWARTFSESPDLLKSLAQKTVNFPVGDYKEAHFFQISDLAEEREDHGLDLELQVSSARDIGTQASLTGSVQLRQPGGNDNGPRRLQKRLESAPWALSHGYEECWTALLETEGLLEAWDSVRQKLRVPFPVDEQERTNQLGSRQFEHPAIPGCGLFEPQEVRNIPLWPRTRHDAQAWAEWSLLCRVSTYATKSRFQGWCKEVNDVFGEWNLELPTRSELLARHSRSSSHPLSRYWHLHAPSDWNL